MEPTPADGTMSAQPPSTISRDNAATPSASASIHAGREARLESLIAEVSARLRRVCSHLTEAEFSALVLDIARVTLRYEERELGALSRPRTASTRHD